MGSTRRLRLALPLLAAAGPAAAEGVVAARVDGMKAMSGATRALGAIRLGVIPYTPEVVRRAGEEIARHAEAAPALFPEGSETPGGDALPAIWAEKALFDDRFARLAEAGARLAASPGEPAAMALAEEIGRQCVGCHDRYRKR